MKYGEQDLVALVQQLLEHTRRLSQSGEASQEDVERLTQRCAECLAQVQAISPGGPSGNGPTVDGTCGREEFVGMLKVLQAETQRCQEVLREHRNKIESEILSLRHTKKAVDAYRSGR